MPAVIRLSRGGTKKRPYYRIVATDSRNPRDGRYIERLGTYNPLLPKDHDQRVTLKTERVQYWLDQGARPSDRVLRFLAEAGMAKRDARNNPNKGQPGKKALERVETKAAAVIARKEAEATAVEEAKEAAVKAAEDAKEAEAKAAEEAKEAEAKAAEEAKEAAEAAKAAEAETPAEEAKEEAPTEEAKEEAPTEEAKEEAPAEEAPKEEAKEEAAPAEGEGDDLTKISGVGPVLVGKLNEQGVTTFAQIAAFTAEDIARVDEALSFKGRIEREEWVEQAKKLIAGEG